MNNIMLFSFSMTLATVSTAWGQSVSFDRSAISVAPGQTFDLVITGDTGAANDVIGFSLYVRVDGTADTPLTVVAARLGSDWEYYGGTPAFPSAIPNNSNSQDYGNAFSVSEFLNAGTYGLTTLTIKVADDALVSASPFSLVSSASSIFLDENFNEYTLAPASLSVTIVPEPATLSLAGIIAVSALGIRRRRYNGTCF